MDYNHPMPWLGTLVYLVTCTFGLFGLWFALPSNFLSKADFRRKLRTYMLYYLWTVINGILLEVISFIFMIIPASLQFLVAFMLPTCRAFDKSIRSKVVNKMGQQDETGTILLEISLNATYAFFIAIRLLGAEDTTVAVVVLVDFFLHLRTTYKIIKQHRKIANEYNEQDFLISDRILKKLILAETIEGLTPITYGICMAMAYYGPNNQILGGIGCSYWTYEAIEDIRPLFGIMALLFGVDTFSVLVNFALIWIMTKKNLISEFFLLLGNYGYLMAIKLGFNLAVYFAGRDINFAADSTGEYNWATNEGWDIMILNATDLTDKEKLTLVNISANP